MLSGEAGRIYHDEPDDKTVSFYSIHNVNCLKKMRNEMEILLTIRNMQVFLTQLSAKGAFSIINSLNITSS